MKNNNPRAFDANCAATPNISTAADLTAALSGRPILPIDSRQPTNLQNTRNSGDVGMDEESLGKEGHIQKSATGASARSAVQLFRKRMRGAVGDSRTE